MKAPAILLLALALSGCATGQRQSVEWITVRDTDQFTDKSTCGVTVGSFYTGGGVYTVPNHYYPYIESANGELRVGIRSGGRFKIPVGDVQIRIDQNPAWTIATGETPVDYVPEGQLKAMQAYGGETTGQTLADRLRQFNTSAFSERPGHSGGNTFRLTLLETTPLEHLWVSACPVEMGEPYTTAYIKHLERKLLWEYVCTWGRYPYCNRS